MLFDALIIGFLWILGITMLFSFCYAFLRVLFVIVGSIFADDPSKFIERYGFKNPPPVERSSNWLW